TADNQYMLDRPQWGRVRTVRQASYHRATPLPVYLLLAYLAAIIIIGKGPTYLGYPPIFWGEIVLFVCLAWTVHQRGLINLLTTRPRHLSLIIALYILVGASLTVSDLPRWA